MKKDPKDERLTMSWGYADRERVLLVVTWWGFVKDRCGRQRQYKKNMFLKLLLKLNDLSS